MTEPPDRAADAERLVAARITKDILELLPDNYHENVGIQGAIECLIADGIADAVARLQQERDYWHSTLREERDAADHTTWLKEREALREEVGRLRAANVRLQDAGRAAWYRARGLDVPAPAQPSAADVPLGAIEQASQDDSRLADDDVEQEAMHIANRVFICTRDADTRKNIAVEVAAALTAARAKGIAQGIAQGIVSSPQHCCAAPGPDA